MEIENAEVGENKWWRSMLANIPDIVMTLDKDGNILYINHTLPSFTPEKVIGTSAFNYIPTGYHESYKQTIDKVFRTGEAAEFEVSGVGPDQTTSWYSTTIAPLKNEKGEVEAVMTVSRDITKSKKLEDEVANLKNPPQT